MNFTTYISSDVKITGSKRNLVEFIIDEQILENLSDQEVIEIKNFLHNKENTCFSHNHEEEFIFDTPVDMEDFNIRFKKSPELIKNFAISAMEQSKEQEDKGYFLVYFGV